MKLLKLVSHPETVWSEGKPTGEKKRKEVFINPEYIISIEFQNEVGNKPSGSKVTVQGAMTASYYDHRLPDILIAKLKEL